MRLDDEGYSGGDIVIPDDANDLPRAPTRAIHIGGAGTIVVDPADRKTSAVAIPVVAGETLRLAATRIRKTGTTATGIIAHYGPISRRGEFTPRDIAGLAAWFRSDLGVTPTITSSLPIVATWGDKSGNGLDLSQSTDALKPIYTLSNPNFGGRPTLEFSRAATTLLSCSTALVPTDNARTIVIANRRRTITPAEFGGLMFSFRRSGAGAGSYIFYNWTAAGPFSDSAHAQNFTSPPSINDTTVVETLTIPASAAGTGATLARVNGVSLALGSGAAIVAESATNNGFEIGSSAFPSQTFHGSIAEIAVFNRVLSSLEITTIERYMGALYGVSIP